MRTNQRKYLEDLNAIHFHAKARAICYCAAVGRSRIKHVTQKAQESAAADCFASYTRCNGDSCFTKKNEKYAFKKLTDCAYNLNY